MSTDYWLFVGLVLLPLCAYCALAGFLVGRGWGRGTEVAELPPPPPPPPPIPDYVPDDWAGIIVMPNGPEPKTFAHPPEAPRR